MPSTTYIREAIKGGMEYQNKRKMHFIPSTAYIRYSLRNNLAESAIMMADTL